MPRANGLRLTLGQHAAKLLTCRAQKREQPLLAAGTTCVNVGRSTRMTREIRVAAMGTHAAGRSFLARRAAHGIMGSCLVCRHTRSALHISPFIRCARNQDTFKVFDPLWYCGGEHVGTVVSDEHVILDTHSDAVP